MTVIIKARVGSHAYGLATPESDEDFLGIFTAPSTDFLGLNPKEAESEVTYDPDTTLHELGKACRLLLACNPTVTELLWFPKIDYLVLLPFGEELIDQREAFLSKNMVRNAYLGYATQQFRRLRDRNDGSFGSDTRKRTAKHARHLLRLLTQGLQLYVSGSLRVLLDDPEWYRSVGDRIAEGDIDLAERYIQQAEWAFDNLHCALPEHADRDAINSWLIKKRLDIAYRTC